MPLLTDPAVLLQAGDRDRAASLVGEVGTESALQCASAWVEAPQARVRALGFEVLGQVALDDARAQAELVARAGAAASDRAVTVREAAVHAVGQSAAKAGRDWLLRMAGDGHPWVRVAVVSCLAYAVDEPAADDPVVQALLVATHDEDIRVRNWATFSLGSLLEVDSPDIREALRRLLGQIDGDTGKDYPGLEALVGLARRGDAAALPVVHQRLAEERVTALTFSAAAALADVSLLPALLAHRAADNEPDDPWVVALEEAITACSANWRDRRFQTDPRQDRRVSENWSCEQLTLNNATDDRPDDLPHLLRRVATMMESHAVQPMDVVDLAVSCQMTANGPWWSVTLSWSPPPTPRPPEPDASTGT